MLPGGQLFSIARLSCGSSRRYDCIKGEKKEETVDYKLDIHLF